MQNQFLYEVVSEFRVETFESTDELTAKYERSGYWESRVTREELHHQPTLWGFNGPMYGGIRDGKIVIRYESSSVYAALSI
ncbi:MULTISPECIES: hypothetical protein [unclassified Thermoactinomyces]|uniref:hypothetical protein n=1 Tax=unclassified Thermoactinomyces TaxID=2634588 RepID=UPI0018DCB6C2|nr:MULTISPECIES: hypothetical protein [unclassified Thermoactinomyces]MBH8599086.1 hypothetical protein [Thermoactinomyces sp. CICC 10523]MBH8607983.1 hypothetical protein [Thermoactinomyces sp. CICC 10521]